MEFFKREIDTYYLVIERQVEGITISDKEMNAKSSYAFKSIFKIFFKTGRKRILITIITGVILFLALTTFFVSWVTYRYNSFYSFIETKDWLDDNRLSYATQTSKYGELEIDQNFMDTQVSYVQTRLNHIISGIGEKYTTAVSLQFRYYEFNETDTLNIKFMAFDNSTENILEDSLVEGRLPVFSNEVLFYRKNGSIPITLNDDITLGHNSSATSFVNNYTVIGIVENVDSAFYQNNRSSDILDDYEPHYADYRKFILYDDILITKYDLFLETANSYSGYTGKLSFYIDFDYEFKTVHIRNIQRYIQQFQDDQIFPYSYGFCFDAYVALLNFRWTWEEETMSIFASAIPFLLIFGLVSIELFKIGDYELESKFKLMKIQGMEYKAIKKMILLENFIIGAISLLVGSLLGFLIGYFIFLGMGNYVFNDFIMSLGEPIIFAALIILFILFFVGGYIIENILAKRTAKSTSMRYKERRKRIFRRIITAQEFLISLPGIGFIAIGLTGMVIISSFFYNPILETIEFQLQLIFWFLTGIGFIFLSASVFLLLTRIVAFIWAKIGKRIWKRTKSFLTLSLKHISIYNKDFQRVILASFIVGLGITPGLVLNKSVKEHIPIESNLSVCYSDIIITDWNNYTRQFRENITKIDGIAKVTEFNIYELSKYDLIRSQLGREKSYDISLVSIENINDFLQILDSKLFEDASFTEEDIIELSNNMTYLMDAKYAKENNYDKDEIFVTSMISSDYNGYYEMTYVNSFDIFPLLYRYDVNYFYKWYERFALVTSELTASQILNHIKSDIYVYSDMNLLIKTSSNAKITKIRDELYRDYGLNTKISSETTEEINADLSIYCIYFFLVGAIISIIATAFFGFITARNIYYRRLRIIESEYQIGAKRNQIWGGFTLELIFIILIPIMLSFGLTIPLLNYVSGFIINMQQSYIKFKPWLPWWFVIILILVICATITSGWLVEIIILMRRYRPIKQE